MELQLKCPERRQRARLTPSIALPSSATGVFPSESLQPSPAAARLLVVRAVELLPRAPGEGPSAGSPWPGWFYKKKRKKHGFDAAIAGRLEAIAKTSYPVRMPQRLA